MRYLTIIYASIISGLAITSFNINAEPPSTDELRKALTPSPTPVPEHKTRGLPLSGVKTRGINVIESTEKATAQTEEPAAPPPPPSVQLQQISFEYNSDKLTHEARQTLDNLATVLKEPDLEKSRFKIIGHTDAMGGAEFNVSLSIRRAQSVMNYLINHHHIDANRLTIEGKGFSELADPAHPDSAANRRVQVTNLGQS